MSTAMNSRALRRKTPFERSLQQYGKVLRHMGLSLAAAARAWLSSVEGKAFTKALSDIEKSTR